MPRGPLLAMVMLPLAGCGPAVGELSGTVVYSGKPLTYGIITAVDTDGNYYNGKINPDGTYKIDRVPTGTVKVFINNKLAPQARGIPGRGGPAPAGWFEIPEKYGNPDRTDLTFHVLSGANTFNITLR
jgi:hypothetical protein